MIVWEDATNYSRGMRGKIEPTAWSCKIKDIDVFITKSHINYKNEWIMKCSKHLDLSEFELKLRGDVDLQIVKDKAISVIKGVIKSRISKFIEILEELEKNQ